MLERLREVRNSKGISQTELGEAVGLTQQSIYKYECTSVEPDIETLKQLSAILDVSVDYLIGNTDIPHKYEHLSACDLNEQETAYIQAFRNLPPRIRESFLILISDWGSHL